MYTIYQEDNSGLIDNIITIEAQRSIEARLKCWEGLEIPLNHAKQLCYLALPNLN